MATTPAHNQPDTLHLVLFYPAHEPRKSDPNYRYFREAKTRMKKAGLLKCVVPGCGFPGPIELHHARVEFALQNGIDLQEFNTLYGLHLSDQEFLVYIESEGNLEPLCPTHHRGALGVHSMPEPQWVALRVWQKDLPPPAKKTL